MTEFGIDFTEEARLDLFHYPVPERKLIASEIRVQLSHQPLVATKNRKPLRTNPLASWELRIGKFRVFYEVAEESRQVTIVSVGHKEHEMLLVRGREVKL